jgi:hypothetical protein
MKNSFLILVFLLSCITIQRSYSQNTQADTASIYRIETTDGNEYLGTILFRDSITIRVKTINIGIIALKWKDINKVVRLEKEEIRNGSDWFQVLQSTRYFWSPNGYGLRKGESYYQNIWVLYNQMGTGISDNFSIGLGLIPLFLIAGTPTPVWITPKFSIPVVPDKFNLGIGALTGIVAGASSTGFGILYGLATLGSHDKNITVGLGYGFAAGSWTQRPLLSLSGMLRVSKKGYLMTENYLINFPDSKLMIVGLGGRSLIRKAGLDYGLAIPVYTGMSTFIAIPWLGLTIPIEARNQK